nr:hypothetical protein [Tanacetum cinerariifolium]
MKWYDYGYLEEIEVQREDQQLYKFREGDSPRLNLFFELHYIEDMLLLLVQKKLFNLERDVIYDLNVALRMFTRRVVILKRVEDFQLGVISYQKNLNMTKPENFMSDITNMTLYTTYNNPQGIIYLDKFKRNRLMRSDELYKFCDGTLTSVRRVLHNIASSLEMDYLPKRRRSKLDRKRSHIMIKAIDSRSLKEEAYTAYSNPRGFIYQNKDNQNRLMRIDKLHKFSDGTLNDVRTALDDRLKGIRMKYLPQAIWRKSDKERAVAMIQAIDKQLKTRRIMRSMEKFVGGRLYEGEFRMLQQTI